MVHKVRKRDHNNILQYSAALREHDFWYHFALYVQLWFLFALLYGKYTLNISA
jgi:hypothetical protein